LTYALLKYQLFVIFAERSASFYSLEINHAKWSGQVSEELGHTNSIDSSDSVYVIVVPGVLVVESEVLFSISPAFLEVGADDLGGSSSSISLSEVESTGWLSILLLLASNTLDSVLVEHVLGEGVNWIVTIISRITLESNWKSSIVGIHEVTVLVDSSWELVHVVAPTLPLVSVFNDLFGLNHHLVVEFILVSSLAHLNSGGRSEQGNN
jgi:hypothetical protein